jgi:hypothetical protein
MATDLAASQQTKAFGFEIFEIDDDPALMQRYGERVPVLVAQDQEICSVKLDRDALADFLTRYGPQLA